MLLLPGIAAFGLFIVFDLNRIKWRSALLNLLFPLGGVLLAVSTLLCIIQAAADFRPGTVSVPGIAGALVSLAALIYALFFALPFDDTYRQSGSLKVVSQGLYGLCRHPGFWPFLLMYVFLWLGFGGRRLLLAALIYPLCNLIYIVIQDKYIFPLYIEGYESYKRSVPFLIPRCRGKQR